MSKKQRFQPRPVVGLSNDSMIETDPLNEEEARIEAVEHILSEESPAPVVEAAPSLVGTKVEVLIERLNFRDSPNTTGKILFPAKKGDIFLADTTKGEWLPVRTISGPFQRGFVLAKYVKEVEDGQHSNDD